MTDHITEYLLAYVENRLDASLLPRVEAHLRGCEACRLEAAATREMAAALAEAGRQAGRIPVNTAKGWAAVRQRWQAPIAVRVRNASHRLSWQVSFSLALVAMAFVSGVSLTTVRAATPSLPSIETPGTRIIAGDDTPTLSATRASGLSETPTLTLTPIPIVTN